MEKVNITKVSATNKKKDGTEIKDNWGKTKWRVGIQTKEYGDTWINGFLAFEPKWEGTEQELIITDSEYNGKPQKNFELPKKDDKVVEMLSQVLTKLGHLHAKVDFMADMLDIKGKAQAKSTPNYPTEELREPEF
jgi:hypothetical protein